jgi:glutamate dehydrogenase (NAD(P)+)
LDIGETLSKQLIQRVLKNSVVSSLSEASFNATVENARRRLDRKSQSTTLYRMQGSSQDVFSFCDRLGPSKVVHISVPSADLRAILVVDNIAAGPAIGGARMAPDVSLGECVRLARAMTLKNAAAGLPHGGAKAVIFGNPKMPADEKERCLRAFAKSIEQINDYIPGPDMGTDEIAMAWIHDEIGRSVGLPRELGGIPLDQIGATGYGLAVAAEVAQEFSGITLEGARAVIEGFGAVGRHAALNLARMGVRLVGVSDSRGAIANPQGLDIEALVELKSQGRSVSEFQNAQKISGEELVGVPCDIWIPAARPDVLRADNVGRLDCRLFLQGANIPATAEAEARMFERGIVNVPDFITNAGGVICAAVEFARGSESKAFNVIRDKIAANTREVLSRSIESGVPPRAAADHIALERLNRAMNLRRWH